MWNTYVEHKTKLNWIFSKWSAVFWIWVCRFAWWYMILNFPFSVCSILVEFFQKMVQQTCTLNLIYSLWIPTHVRKIPVLSIQYTTKVACKLGILEEWHIPYYVKTLHGIHVPYTSGTLQYAGILSAYKHTDSPWEVIICKLICLMFNDFTVCSVYFMNLLTKYLSKPCYSRNTKVSVVMDNLVNAATVLRDELPLSRPLCSHIDPSAFQGLLMNSCTLL